MVNYDDLEVYFDKNDNNAINVSPIIESYSSWRIRLNVDRWELYSWTDGVDESLHDDYQTLEEAIEVARSWT